MLRNKKLLLFLVLFIFINPIESDATNEVIHVVYRTQSLSAIAKGYGVHWKELMKWNNLSDTMIHPGDRLIVFPRTYIAVASWYGPKFHGKQMANGETFDQYVAEVVAHKTLPLGTLVMIENVENGYWLMAEVKDRGPYIRGRDFDLSYAGASDLGFEKKGLTTIKITILGTPYKR